MRTSVNSRSGLASANAASADSASPNSRASKPASRSAAASTRRTARSSSTTQASGAALMPRAPSFAHRQQQAEHGRAGPARMAEVAAVLARDLAREREAEPAAVGTSGDERFVQRVGEFGRYAAAVV